MNSAIERILTLRVADVMAREVVTVSQNVTMAEAADILRNAGVTGAPVVDEFGRCVGVISGTDFVSSTSEEIEEYSAITHVLSKKHPAGTYRVEEVASDLVRAHMTREVQTIQSRATLVNAGRYMCREHIHRLVVVDKHSRPVGIVSSLDFVSAVINAVEE